MTCPNPACKREAVAPRGIDKLKQPKNGDTFLCPGCGHLGVYILHVDGPPTLRQMLETEYQALTPDELNDIAFVIRIIQAQHKKLNQKLILPPWFNPNPN